jgi:hypothetical protein
MPDSTLFRSIQTTVRQSKDVETVSGAIAGVTN